MACGSQQKYGYEDSRFQHEVGESLHCPICLNVLKQPNMCANNQHVFCHDCIIAHLQNNLTCPECREQLTVETLKPVSRVLMNCLSELHIKCDYFDRGCHGFVEVRNLDNHVMKCGFAPTKCLNDGCTVVVNKRDLFHHEREVCQFGRIKCHVCGELRNEIGELREEFQAQVEDVQDTVNKKHDELKQQINDIQVMLSQMFDNIKSNWDEMKKSQEVMQEQLNQLPTKLNIVQHTISSSLHDKQILTKKDIIIAGGLTDDDRTRSVEIYSRDNGLWAQLPDMKASRAAASCFVYQNQVFVAGGWSDFAERTDIIEVMTIDQEPLQWQIFPGKLPTKLCCHKTVVYNNKLIVIGGESDKEFPNDIYEILLTPPYSSKLLSKMTIPRICHGVEIVNNKVFILGGHNKYRNVDTLDNVCVYDVVKKKFREMSPLPYGVSEMSTVVWRKKIIVIGGKDRNGEILSKVVMYDVETGESETLPYMKYKRRGCTSVATGDGMIVMGGWNEKNEELKSVEYFNMSSRSWQELPSMIEARAGACAVVKP